MTAIEANQLADKLKALIPTMTAEQGLAVAVKLDGLPRSVGERAIHRYAETATDFVLAGFLMLLRAEKERAPDAPASPRNDYRYIDALRADMTAKGVRGASSWSEPELVLQCGRAWFAARGGFHHDDDTVAVKSRCTPGHQQQIRREVMQVLTRDLKFDPDLAERMAAACFEPRAYFDYAIDELHNGAIVPAGLLAGEC